MPAKFLVLGSTDEVTTCDCCGKSNLKATWAVEMIDADGATLYYGSTCVTRNTGARTMNQVNQYIDKGTLVRIRTSNGGDTLVKLVQDYRPNFTTVEAETTDCVNNYTWRLLTERIRSIETVNNYWSAPMTEAEAEDILERVTYARRNLRRMAA